MYAALLGGSVSKSEPAKPVKKPSFCKLLQKEQGHYAAGYHDAQGHHGGEFQAKDHSGDAESLKAMQDHHLHGLGWRTAALIDHMNIGGKHTDDISKSLAEGIAANVKGLKELGSDHETIAKSLTTQGLGMWLKKKHGLPLTAQEQKNIDSTMKSAIALQNKKQAAKKMEDHKKNSALAEEAKAKFGEDSKEYKKLKSKAEKDLNKAMSYGVLPQEAAKEKEAVQEDHTAEKEKSLAAITHFAEQEAHIKHLGLDHSGVKAAVDEAISTANHASLDEIEKALTLGQHAHAAKVATGKDLLTKAVLAHAQVQHQKTEPKTSEKYKDYKTASTAYQHHYNKGADEHGLNAEDKKEAVKAGKQAFVAMKHGAAPNVATKPPEVPPTETLAPAPQPAMTVEPVTQAAPPNPEGVKSDFFKALDYAENNPNHAGVSFALQNHHGDIDAKFGKGTADAWAKEHSAGAMKKNMIKALDYVNKDPSDPYNHQSLAGIMNAIDQKHGAGKAKEWMDEHKATVSAHADGLKKGLVDAIEAVKANPEAGALSLALGKHINTIDSELGSGTATKWLNEMAGTMDTATATPAAPHAPETLPTYHVSETPQEPMPEPAAEAAPLSPKEVKAATAAMKKKLLKLADDMSKPDATAETAKLFADHLAKVKEKVGEVQGGKWLKAHLAKAAKNPTSAGAAVEKPDEIKQLEASKPKEPVEPEAPKLPLTLPTNKSDAESLNETMGMHYYKLRLKHGGSNSAPEVAAAYKDWNTVKDHMKATMGYDSNYFSSTSADYKQKAQSEWSNKTQTVNAKTAAASLDYTNSVAKWHAAIAAGKSAGTIDHLKEGMITNGKIALVHGVEPAKLAGLYDEGKAKFDEITKKAKAEAHKEIADASHSYFIKAGLHGEDSTEAKEANVNALNIMAKHDGLLSPAEQHLAFGSSKEKADKTVTVLKSLGDLGSVAASYDENASNFTWVNSKQHSDELEHGTKVLQALTAPQRKSLKDYTNGSYSQLNYDASGTHAGGAETKAKSEDLYAALVNSRLLNNMNLRRNMPQKWFFKAMGLPHDSRNAMTSLTDEQLQSCVGKVYREPSFSSTSFDQHNTTFLSNTGSTSGGAIAHIRANKDVAQAIWMDTNSSCSSEREVVLNRGATYVVRGIKRNTVGDTYRFPYIFDLDLIGHTTEPLK